MIFQVSFTPSAEQDLKSLQVYEQRIIVAAIRSYLLEDADIENKRRKQLGANKLAPWELRAGKYRVFYEWGAGQVKVVAIGYKEHNELLIRGRKVEL
jgi:mRNA-degrading endonuclease RelE of RelBE toxin-antitoxin system